MYCIHYAASFTRWPSTSPEKFQSLGDLGAHKLLAESYTRPELSAGPFRETYDRGGIGVWHGGIVARRVTGRREGGVGHQLKPLRVFRYLSSRADLHAWACFTAAAEGDDREKRVAATRVGDLICERHYTSAGDRCGDRNCCAFMNTITLNISRVQLCLLIPGPVPVPAIKLVLCRWLDFFLPFFPVFNRTDLSLSRVQRGAPAEVRVAFYTKMLSEIQWGSSLKREIYSTLYENLFF